MAVEEFPCADTTSLVQPHSAFYPVSIPIAHYQLRHFISSPQKDLVYYADGASLFCLNIATKTRSLVTVLDFNARCTASGHGYVCVAGGSNGSIAVVRVVGYPPGGHAGLDMTAAGDVLRNSPLPHMPVLGTASEVKYDNVGQDIVNSISVHRLQAEGYDDDVVAVLSNNDRTVRIYSLLHQLELHCLDLPFAMNHATISPDGQWMAAVGDGRQAFFFERRPSPKRSASMSSDEGRALPPPQSWVLASQVRLHSPESMLGCSADYFCTAWAPSGQLCALASEWGYITVVDTLILRQNLRTGDTMNDPIVTVIKSTRPGVGTCPGSVRTMQFSPAPLDLLIWSEDQAHVCVADLRTSLRRKQVLVLDSRAADVDKMDFTDFEIDLDVVREVANRRVQARQDEEDLATVHNWFTNTPDRPASGRQRALRLINAVDSDLQPLPLSGLERRALEPWPPQFHMDEAPSSSSSSASPQAMRNWVVRASEAVDTTGPSRSMADTYRSHFVPRRQPTMVGMRDEAGTATGLRDGTTAAAGAPHITDGGLTRSPNALSAQARRGDMMRQMYRDPIREVREAREARQVNPRRHDMGFDPALGERTTGIALTDDGRTLYCGVEEGIFEFQINLHDRMLLPAVDMR